MVKWIGTVCALCVLFVCVPVPGFCLVCIPAFKCVYVQVCVSVCSLTGESSSISEVHLQRKRVVMEGLKNIQKKE